MEMIRKKIFISHKKEDANIANKIANIISTNGYDYYLDQKDSITADNGKELTEHIIDALDNCDETMVIYSRNTKDSQWVPFEIGASTERRMTIVIFNINGSEALPEFLEYWPELRNKKEIDKYLEKLHDVEETRVLYEGFDHELQNDVVDSFYRTLKEDINRMR